MANEATGRERTGEGQLNAGETTSWAIGGAIEHGAFLMALAAVLLTSVAILLALGGVIAYIRVRDTARKVATKVAQDTARALAEKAANDYLQAEIPAILAAYGESGQSVSGETADSIAKNQGESDAHF